MILVTPVPEITARHKTILQNSTYFTVTPSLTIYSKAKNKLTLPLSQTKIAYVNEYSA